MAFKLSKADRDILIQRLRFSRLFVQRLESMLEPGDDGATVQTVEDLIAEGDITVGDDLTVSGDAVITGGLTAATLTDANGTVKPFKRYVALLTQSSTSAPTATILKNELGVTPTLGRTSAGIYTITATGLFTTSKTAITIGGQIDLLNRAKAIHTSANVVTVSTSVLSESSNVLIQTPTDGLLTAALIDIKVFD